jgi:hypothetical protein
MRIQIQGIRVKVAPVGDDTLPVIKGFLFHFDWKMPGGSGAIADGTYINNYLHIYGKLTLDVQIPDNCSIQELDGPKLELPQLVGQPRVLLDADQVVEKALLREDGFQIVTLDEKRPAT